MTIEAYNKGKMQRLAKEDRYIGFVVRDLQKRGNSEDDALKAVYNENVLMGDNVMRAAYRRV